MSSQKTLKRISLVAVSVLSLGFLSIAPSSAAQSDTLTAATTSSSVKTDAEAKIDFTLSYIASGNTDTMLVTPVLMSGPSTNTKWGVDLTYAVKGTDVNVGGVVKNAGTGVLTYTPTAAGRITAARTVSFTPDVAGTYVFKFTASGGVNNENFTWTITATDPAVATTKAFISDNVGVAPAADAAASALIGSATINAIEKARIAVNQYTDAAATTLIDNKYAQAVTVAISGAGLVGTASGGAGRGPSVTIAAATDATADFYVFSDGRSGTGTITITSGSTVITKTFVFFGSGAGVKQDVTTTAPKALIKVGQTDALNFNVTDANGNLTGNNAALAFATSSDTAVATVTAANGVVTVTGVAVGTATITVCNTASCTAATLSASTTVKVASGTVASVKMAWDKASYVSGEKMTLTVSAADSTGAAVGDDTYTLFSTAPTFNEFFGTGTGIPAAFALVDGKRTYTYFAPVNAGTFTVSGVDNTTAKNAVSASAEIGNPAATAAEAATDAALEAIDAANAATDAANLAAEAADAATVAAEEARDAADAATAAVEALASEVATLIASLKAQITTLANTVAKIAKKVRA